MKIFRKIRLVYPCYWFMISHNSINIQIKYAMIKNYNIDNKRGYYVDRSGNANYT
jgi:hypothetical protein